jgi:hypothetical protein
MRPAANAGGVPAPARPPLHHADIALQQNQQHRPALYGMANGPISATDWTDDERAEIGRLETVCDACDHWTLECSCTDEGDPWCVIYDQAVGRIIIHIARIGREYVVVWGEQRVAKTKIMAEAIYIVLGKLRPHRRRRG